LREWGLLCLRNLSCGKRQGTMKQQSAEIRGMTVDGSSPVVRDTAHYTFRFYGSLTMIISGGQGHVR